MTEDNNPYLAKWLNNDLTSQELEQFKQSEEFEDYEKIAKGIEYFEAPSFDEDASLEVTLQKLMSRKKTKVIRLKPIIYSISVAASILLIIGLFFNTITHTADQGKQIAVTLPDGSQADLNAGSSITYQRFFWSKNRKIKLKGEALFQVKNGNTFMVHTDHGSVAVLGTIFNVKSRTTLFEVACYEGKVRVETKTNDQKVIEKGEAVVLSDGVLNTRKISDFKPLWKKGESLFVNTPLREVLDELERQYKIKFTRTNIDEKKLFSGGFLHNNLDIALEAVLVPMNIDYVINGTVVKLSNK